MNTLRHRLLLALGVALPACDEEEVYREVDGFYGPYEQADSGLPIFPSANVRCPPDRSTSDPGCSLCCEVFACYRPEPGIPCQQAPLTYSEEAYDLAETLGAPWGTDVCRAEGPFDPRAAGRAADECCYVVSTMTCSGRPLLVAGLARRGALVRRSDWGGGGRMNTLRHRLLLALGAILPACDEEGEAYREPDAFFGPYDVADGGLPVFPLERVQCPPDPGDPRSGMLTLLRDLRMLPARSRRGVC